MTFQAKLIIGFIVVFFLGWIVIILNIMGDSSSQANITDNQTNNKNNDISTGSDENNNQNFDNSSSNSTGENEDVNSNNTEKQLENNFNTTINVAIPKKFTSKGFKILGSKLQNKFGITVKYNTFKNMNEYKKELLVNAAEGSGKYDVYMIPTTWLETFKKYFIKINIQDKGIINSFLYLFSDYFNKEGYTYVPFGIDPVVTFVANTDYFKNIDNITPNSLKEYILTKGGDNKDYIPVLFGLTERMLSFMNKGKLDFYNYFDMLYNFVYIYSKNQNNEDLFNFIMEISNKDSIHTSWSIKKYIKNKNKLEDIDPTCKNYDIFCMFLAKNTDVIFSYLSDIDKMKSISSNFERNMNDVLVKNIIGVNSNYPVRGWGLGVNNNSSNKKSSIIFLNQYIEEGLAGNNYFWDNTISPFINIYEKQRQNDNFSVIMNYKENFEVLQTKTNYIDDFKSIGDLYDNIVNKNVDSYNNIYK